MKHKPVISILGCGWYGFGLAASLTAAGHTVKGSTTSAEKMQALAGAGIEPYLVNFGAENATYGLHFFECDILWIAIPPKTRHGEGDAYTAKLAHIAQAAQKHNVKQVIYISSTGVYGDHNHKVDEQTPPAPATPSGKILLQAEQLLQNNLAFSTTIIRFGGLFGPNRNPGRFFAGKKQIPNGRAPVNMIHLDDCLGISHAILNKKAFGHTFNACAPQHPEKWVFYTQAARNTGLELPEFNDELLEWKIVNSINIPQLLQYRFKHPL